MNVFGLPKGNVTDDSEMGMSLAYAILSTSDIELDEDILYFFYGLWYYSGPFDMGYTTRTALRYFDIKNSDINSKGIFKKAFDIFKVSISDSKANGFLMRISPLIVYFYYKYKEGYLNSIFNEKNDIKLIELYEKIKEESKKDCYCTHPNEENNVMSSIFIIMGLCSIYKRNAKEIIDIVLILVNLDEFKNKNKKQKEVSEMLIKIINDFNNFNNIILDKETYFNNIDRFQVGFYLNAFKLTLFYLVHWDNIFVKEEKKDEFTKYRKIINDICDFGGDTDTNAAIVGAIIGPLIGYKNFGDDFDIFITYINEGRIFYTNFVMYYYVMFLKKKFKNEESEKKLKDNNENDIKKKSDEINEKENKEVTNDKNELNNNEEQKEKNNEEQKELEKKEEEKKEEQKELEKKEEEKKEDEKKELEKKEEEKKEDEKKVLDKKEEEKKEDVKKVDDKIVAKEEEKNKEKKEDEIKTDENNMVNENEKDKIDSNNNKINDETIVSLDTTKATINETEKKEETSIKNKDNNINEENLIKSEEEKKLIKDNNKEINEEKSIKNKDNNTNEETSKANDDKKIKEENKNLIFEKVNSSIFSIYFKLLNFELENESDII